MIGTIGHISVLAAFVATLAAGVAFLLATRERDDAESWAKIGRWAWAAMAVCIAVTSAMLWTALFGRHFEFAYVYQQTSTAMPWHYTFSSFWAGQEGSFLLWIIMTAAAGGLMIHWWTSKKGLGEVALQTRRVFGAPVLAVVALCQAFLLSMIVGLKIGPVPIGVNPFMRLAEKFPDAPMLQVAGFVPAEGQGLNDLLQNPWMVIHPPTLFLGFTLLMIPFAFAVAGLWKGRYTQWVRPALAWSLAGCGVLGIGIMMGGYWAYETLSFGGWWAWDPVENSSLVPWLFATAALHAMVVQKRTAAGHKAALWLSVVAFQMVIYSTFLTRSGVLGGVSVHSFVDLGLYNQLLLWIGTIGVLGFGLLIWRYRDLPAPTTPPATLSRESMIFTGALLLALVGLVIALGTSAPIIGNIFRDNPSAVPVSFYNTWTLPLAVGITFLAGLGQLFWWRKMDIEAVHRVMLRPLILTVVSTAAVVLFTPFVQETVRPPLADASAAAATINASILPAGIETFLQTHGTSLLLLLLVFSTFLSLYGNGLVMWRIGRGNAKMVGGSLTHVGFAIMMLGIFSSAVFNDPISDGNGTDVQGSRENVVVPLGATVQSDGYTFTYTGQETNDDGRPVYVMKVTDRKGRSFETRNVVYKDVRDQWIQHPDVRERPFRDLYVAVFPAAMSEQNTETNEPEELQIARGDSVSLASGSLTNAYKVRFVDYDLAIDLETIGVPRDSIDLAVAAKLEVTNNQTGETRMMRPVYLITKDNRQQFVQNRAMDWGLGVTFVGMVVDEGAIKLVLEGAQAQPEDWLVVQAQEKPFISLLWLGVIIIGIGFGVSTARRMGDDRR